MTEHSHAELQELLGAFALDAVDGDERELVELHLRECPRCRAEVMEHREAAALLAHGGVRAPEGIWSRIAASLDEAPPAVAAPVALASRRRSRVGTWAAAVAAAIAIVVASALGWVVGEQDRRIDELETASADGGLYQALASATADPRARQADLVSTDGTVLARAVLLPSGDGFLVAEHLRRLAPDRTYQLWVVMGDEAISAGVLGRAPRVVAFRAAGDVGALAITEEIEGGVVRSRNQPVVSGAVRV